MHRVAGVIGVRVGLSGDADQLPQWPGWHVGYVIERGVVKHAADSRNGRRGSSALSIHTQVRLAGQVGH